MGSCSEEEEDRFFESREELASLSDSGSDHRQSFESSSGPVNWVSGSFQYEVWVKIPESIRERRNKFLKWMGLNLDGTTADDSRVGSLVQEVETERITENSGSVLRSSDFENGFSSSRSSFSFWSNDAPNFSEDGVSAENFVCRIKNLDDGTEFVVDELGQDGMLSRLRQVGSNRLVTLEEFEKTLWLSPLVQQFMRREVVEASNSVDKAKRVKRGWLRRLLCCIVCRQGDAGDSLCHYSNTALGRRVQKVRVRPYRKRSKELSALYRGQEISAHEGSILTMKFSLDGQCLASAGEDGVVRIWQVIEAERSSEDGILDIDPSFVYFTINHSSELVPLFADKEKPCNFKTLRKTSDSVCVILPPKVFRLSEKPLHEYHGHSGEVLDLSWSKDKYLLSSSVDKTVRLWRVGFDGCLRVFFHNNYVTCIQFNPVNDNYFISGSIDGKVRIWEIPGCQVVDWTDVREIVTAVCYRPDGQGGIVGSLTGNCRFYDASGNCLQLDDQICLLGKKKKRITGFQFSPSDPSKVIVTSADSHVRILDGVDVVCKFRGLWNAGSQMPASFTADGKHVISLSEDSNVYVWNYNTQDGPVPSQAKSISSCERFFSDNASIAVPWCGLRCGPAVSSTVSDTRPSPKKIGDPPASETANGWMHCQLDKNLQNVLPRISDASSPDCFSLSHGFFLEALPKGSATWPEEKLPASGLLSVSATVRKSQYKFLKTSCQNLLSSHAWSLVIVTAGWDGRIRSFLNYGLPVRI
ncbi:vegetative incompatibility protein HET-E-1-like [Telopea speciosissima]|uniref:vegetative incompatibility protein HET-E-1-like n=1 Tax=Telopea speciosissima TaxID=54955 RepID=UPI001CC65E77|nr:vegetative incompatibility protein HET-E-1-like [Telopea speciosissima]